MPTEVSPHPTIGDLVRIRGQRWIVSTVDPAPRNLLVGLESVEENRYGESLDVIWDIEPGALVLPAGALPEVSPDGFDPPERLAAFLDAVRWSAVTSADVKTLQAPFRSGVAVENYQLEPVARAVDAPRVNLLLADDVGLGKTVEAGLVALELMLRHRGQKVLIVCPAGLTLKWRDEMAEKFGLDFTIINSEQCAIVRRTYGSAANPFLIYPHAIVSLPWLREAKAQRLLAEILPADGPAYPRTFDLLILDEAHHVAPAAPKQVYAVDSQQTKLIRWLAPHFAHRLFLSATPHNGYQASFTALLEILDDQRFARGVEPDKAAVKDTVVRRLKRDIRNDDGSIRFVERTATAIGVAYPDDEREAHALLEDFARARRARLTSRRGRAATDLVTLLLKKRLFSSPAAFARTVAVYRETLKAKTGFVEQIDDDVPDWLADHFDDVAAYDDERLADAEVDILERSRPLQPDPTMDELALLDRMERWAVRYEAQADAKATQLLDYLQAVCRPDGEHWTDERVVVFTEYRDTQLWLSSLLRQEGLAGARLEELHGAIPTDERERIRLAFQKPPAEHAVRILLATDAASEGIDLQKHCHRLVNYDIPFNPNKLEQRIGRIDRYGQKVPPDIRHFAGTGLSGDPFEADLEFLSRVAKKITAMKEDLGAVNAVIADKIVGVLAGNDSKADLDIARRGAVTSVQALPTETNLPEQLIRLGETVDNTVRELGITPGGVKRVVDTALALANQQPLRPHVDQVDAAPGLYDVPPLTGSWARAAAGLTEKLPREGEKELRQLPITFDELAAADRDDVIYAHLNHPLVAMSTDLLRAAVSNDEVGLHRVTALVSDDPRLEDVLVGAFARYVLVGADGIRLHEEVLHAGGYFTERSFRRLDNLTTLRSLLEDALHRGTAASPAVTRELAERWPRVREGLLAAVDWRTEARRKSLDLKLTQRQSAEEKRIVANLEQFAATLRAKLAEGNEEDALFGTDVLQTREERAQYRQDRASWERRLQQLETERDRELGTIAARYRDPRPHRVPLALVFVVPRREAIR